MLFAVSSLGVLIPNLVILLALTAASFQYASTMAPVILLVCSVLLLSYAVFLNRAQFANDYKYSTWQRGMVGFRYVIMLAVLSIVIYGGYALNSKSTTPMLGGRRR